MRAMTEQVTTHVAYAYTLLQGAQSNGCYHAVLDQPLHTGRLDREPGDALCRPRRAFWGLEPVSHGAAVSCKRCLDVAARYSIAVRLEQQDGSEGRG